MNSPTPDPHPTWTIAQLVEALNDMRDMWTRVAMELRDIQFHRDTALRQDAIERANTLLKKAKSH
jgi:hypothetical protein